ncbi:MAG: yedK [Enterovirga sp.]|jgi:putative SOS response-associated peptidase YedK|nr:yedK [Enterovirga sp.]
MCGRVIQAADPTLYTRAVGSAPERPLPNAPPHYNGAPSQDFLVGRVDPRTGERSLDLLRWGLIPSWAKDRKIAWKTINARGETVASTAAFKGAYAKRRCLVPVDGFYEWRKIGAAKQPYAIGLADGEPFTLAGLWENWKDPDTGAWQRTFTIVTTDANSLVGKLHDRMPVIIAPQDRDRWLTDPDPRDLIRPFPAEAMRMWPVSRDVNSPKNDGRELLEPVPEPGWPEEQGEVEDANDPAAALRPANSA